MREVIAMPDGAPLEIPATIAGTTTETTPVYRYLMQQPDHWMRQAFFVGRPKLPVARLVESMQANNQTITEAACEWSLPVEAIEEALDYCKRFQDLIESDEADELALSEEIAQRHSFES